MWMETRIISGQKWNTGAYADWLELAAGKRWSVSLLLFSGKIRWNEGTFVSKYAHPRWKFSQCGWCLGAGRNSTDEKLREEERRKQR